MRELLRAGCELLADNKDLLSKNFSWGMEMLSLAGSVIYTGAGRVADIERIKECKKILKKNLSMFSEFRGNMEVPVLCKMALAQDPEKYLTELIGIYNKLSKGKIFGSDYLALTAFAICDENLGSSVDRILERTKRLLKRMAGYHPILTSDEDMALVALLAVTDKSDDQIIEETEYCYHTLKKMFSSHDDAVQSLSHVLTLCGGMPQENCDKVCAIYDALKIRGIKYGLDYELASLGALVSIDMSPTELAAEIEEASEYLKTRKGFGDWGIGDKARTMFAALMAVQAFAPSSVAMDASVLNSSLAIVIAEEMCCVAAMSVAASSST